MEHLDLPATAAAARTGRAFVSAYCSRHQVPCDATAEAVLLTSELLTNAYLHARSPAVLTIGLLGQVLRVEVADESDTQPATRAPGPGSAGGRGMHLIGSIAQEWGVLPRQAGKAIWFELSAAS